MASHAGYSFFFHIALGYTIGSLSQLKNTFEVFFRSYLQNIKVRQHDIVVHYVLYCSCSYSYFKLLELTDILGYFYLYYFVRVLFNIIIDMLWLWLAG